MASRSLDGPYRRPPVTNPHLTAALKESLARDLAHYVHSAAWPYRWIERIDMIQEVSGQPRSDIIAEVRGEALAIRERRFR